MDKLEARGATAGTPKADDAQPSQAELDKIDQTMRNTLAGHRPLSQRINWTENRPAGQWHLRASETSPADLDAQVTEILSRLSSDLTVWASLCSRFDVDLFCGWFLDKENEGLGISAKTLISLGERGIELSLDIYAGDEDAA